MPYGRKGNNKNIAAQKALLSKNLNVGTPTKASPQTPSMPYGRDTANNKNVSAQKALLSNKLNFGTPAKVAPKTPPRVEQTKPYGRDTANNKNVSAQKALLSNKLNFGTPAKVAPKTPPRAKGASKDPNFSANRTAIADKIMFGGHPPPSNQRKAATAPKPSGGKEFQNQKAALAAKLNFRPPIPPGGPRGEPSHPTAARPVPKPKSPPPGSDFANQKAALASKLVFRPPLPTSGGPKVSPQQPTIPFSSTPQEPVYSPKSQAAAIASRNRSHSPEDVRTTSSSAATSVQDARSVRTTSSAATSVQDSRSVRSMRTTSSSATTSLQDARSIQSGDPPPKPEMSFVRSNSYRKDNPPPAEPEMKYVRSYRIGGAAEEPKAHVTPKEKVAGDGNARVKVVLIREKYEWGTRPVNKRYEGNRVTVKRFTTNDEEEGKRQKNKKGGCTIM